MVKCIITATCIAISSLIIACSQLSRSKSEIEIKKITIASGGGEKPIYWAIQFDSSLSFKSYRKYNQSNNGFYEGRISRAQWDTLVNRLKTSDYNLLRRSYVTSATDDNIIEVIVNSSSGTVYSIGMLNAFPSKIKEFLSSYHDLIPQYLIKSKDSIQFDSKVQYGFKQ